MKIRNLIEEFSDMIKVGDFSYSIHKNPNSKEIREIIKEATKNAEVDAYELDAAKNVVRYIVDLNNKDIYVFSALVLHEKVSKKIGIPYRGSFDYLFDSGFVNKDGKILISNRIAHKLKTEKFKNLDKTFALKEK